jgi:hypothetical protein
MNVSKIIIPIGLLVVIGLLYSYNEFFGVSIKSIASTTVATSTLAARSSVVPHTIDELSEAVLARTKLESLYVEHSEDEIAQIYEHFISLEVTYENN